MAARSIGTLTLSFGLVAIPVKLYSATQSANAISFNLLHKGCGSRLRQQYVCAREGTLVERNEMVKGYEFAKDQYVTFEPQEICARCGGRSREPRGLDQLGPAPARGRGCARRRDGVSARPGAVWRRGAAAL
jgi:hypothetical protein